MICPYYRQCPPGTIAHIVEEGDTFSSLADKYCISISKIVYANATIEHNHLKAGEVIYIPVHKDYPPCPQSSHYVVRPGDTLYKIALDYHLSPDELIALNPKTNPDQLIVGDILCLPAAAFATTCPPGTTLYIVKKGDTFYSISKQFNIKIAALMRANSKINPDSMMIGQSLFIPKPWHFYTNPEYHVTFQYPYRWSKFDALRYEGIDGFFQITSRMTHDTLESVTHEEASYRLKPYGSHPAITKLTIDSQDACLILPSSDQLLEMREQSALIVQYPEGLFDPPIDHPDSDPLQHYFVLWADKKHIEDMLCTIKFLKE